MTNAIINRDGIAVTPEMRRFNNAVEAADTLLAVRRVDELCLAHLLQSLLYHGFAAQADELMKAGVAAGVINPCP